MLGLLASGWTEEEVLDAATQTMGPHPVAAEIARRAKASEVWSDWVWRRLLSRAGVVQASGGFSDTGIADAVVDKLKGAIEGVGEG